MKNILIKNITSIDEDIFPLAEVKLFLRVACDGDDELIRSNILAASEFAEQYLGRYVYKRKVVCIYQPGASKEITLPNNDIISLEEVKLVGEEGILLENDKDFQLNNNKIILSSNFRSKPLEITYISGFSAFPEAIKHGILYHVSMLYDKEIMDYEKRESLFLFYRPYRNLRVF